MLSKDKILRISVIVNVTNFNTRAGGLHWETLCDLGRAPRPRISGNWPRHLATTSFLSDLPPGSSANRWLASSAAIMPLNTRQVQFSMRAP